jgi:hypothetical protein
MCWAASVASGSWLHLLSLLWYLRGRQLPSLSVSRQQCSSPGRSSPWSGYQPANLEADGAEISERMVQHCQFVTVFSCSPRASVGRQQFSTELSIGRLPASKSGGRQRRNLQRKLQHCQFVTVFSCSPRDSVGRQQCSSSVRRSPWSGCQPAIWRQTAPRSPKDSAALPVHVGGFLLSTCLPVAY